MEPHDGTSINVITARCSFFGLRQVHVAEMPPCLLQHCFTVKVRFLGIRLIRLIRTGSILGCNSRRRVGGVSARSLGLQGAILVDILRQVQGEEDDKIDLFRSPVTENVSKLM